MPSPAASAGASVQCSRPVGVFGNSSRGRGLREQLAAALDVVREAAGGEHDAAAGRDGVLAFRAAHGGAGDPAAVVGGQADRRRRDADVHAQVVGRLHQPAGQRGAVDQLHVPPVHGQVPQVRDEPAGGVEQAGNAAL
jgi:hypothetical protein